MPSALGPAALGLWAYISSKSLMPMLQLLLMPTWSIFPDPVTYYPLCWILNSAYYANNYAGIFDAGLSVLLNQVSSQNGRMDLSSTT